MKTRLFIYIISLIFVLFGIVFLFLSLFGGISNADEKAGMLLSSRLESYSNDVVGSFRTLAGKGIQLSERISAALEQTMDNEEFSFEKTANCEVQINEMERNAYDIMLSSLQAADCSGVFMILDTTVNTELERSFFSKSGLYLKMTNLNVSQPVNPEILLYRGSARVGLDKKVTFHNQWKLEFDINDFAFFRSVYKEVKGKNIKDYYYISEATSLPGTWERAMFICVPILGTDGTIYGVCGFEVSELYYCLAFMETDTELKHFVGILSQRQESSLNIQTGLSSGNCDSYFDERKVEQCEVLRGSSFNTYQFQNSNYIGKTREIQFSAGGSNSEWAVTVMIPQSDYLAWAYERRKGLIIFCAFFLMAAILLSSFFSRRYVRPIVKGLEGIKSPECLREAKVPEIDNLMAFLAKRDQEREKNEKPVKVKETKETLAATTELYQNFVSNIQLLSAAERAVFDLYMEGYTAKEIAERLFLSINTIKTHNRRIYAKLNVSSRKELMVYVRMMEEVGQYKNVESEKIQGGTDI